VGFFAMVFSFTLLCSSLRPWPMFETYYQKRVMKIPVERIWEFNVLAGV
jgi:hypothetical protein